MSISNIENDTDNWIRSYLLLVYLKKSLLFLSVFIFLFLGNIYVETTQKLYSTTMDIMLNDNTNTSPVEPILNIQHSRSTMNEHAELIVSSLIVDKVIDRLEQEGISASFLLNQARSKGNVFLQIWKQLKSVGNILSVGKENSTVTKSSNSKNIYSEKLSLRLLLISNISTDLEFNSKKLQVEFSWYNPEMAFTIANILADVYVLDHLEARYEASKNASAWLSNRLASLKADLNNSEIAVEKFKVDNKLENFAGFKLYEVQIVKFNDQLIDAKAKEEEYLAKYNQVREIVNTQSVLALPDSIYSRTISSLNSQLLDIKRTETELSNRYGNRHPNVISAKVKREKIQSQIKAETNKMVLAAENDYKVAKSRRKSVEESLQNLTGTGGLLNKKAVKLRELEREVETNRNLFNAFLQRTKEVSADLVPHEPVVRVINKPITPINPSHPNRFIIFTISILLGLFVGLVVIQIISLFDVGLYNETDVNNNLDLDLIGQIPQIIIGGSRFINYWKNYRDKNKINTIIPNEIFYKCLTEPFSNYAEAIRNLRLNIKYSNSEEEAKIVTVTSTVPNEGKSTLAMNLANYAAQTGEKVLLIDGDIRNPALAKKFLPDIQKGIIDYLFYGDDEIGVINHTPTLDNLHFACMGSLTNIQYTKKLASEKMKNYLREKSKLYDLIIIDSSPLLYTQDTREYIKVSDGVLYVVEWGVTDKGLIASVINSSPELKENTLGIVFTKIKINEGKYYGYYGTEKSYEYSVSKNK